MTPPKHDKTGERYVRRYFTMTGPSWALFEHQRGRFRRVGTARTEQDYRRFLGLVDA